MPPAKKTIKVKVKVTKPKTEKKSTTRKTAVKKSAAKPKKSTTVKKKIAPKAEEQKEVKKEEINVVPEKDVVKPEIKKIDTNKKYSESSLEEFKKKLSEDISDFNDDKQVEEAVEGSAKSSSFLSPYATSQESITVKKEDNFLARQKVIQQNDKEENTDEDETDSVSSRSVGLYRKIAFSFILLTVALLSVIFYFSFLKVTIVLIPNQERINSNMIFDIYDKDTNASGGGKSVDGIVKSVGVNYEKNYPASGSEVIGKEVVGTVKIINNYTKNQPLVATTRLLTSDNKLFRIKDTVNVPAGGSIEVEVYADEPSPEMAVGPTKFTIPGLWAGLQEQIYAENSQEIVYRQKIKKSITQEDIDNSTRDIKQELLAKAKSDINGTYGDYSEIIFKINEDSVKSKVDGKVGEEKDELNVSMEADIVVVAFNGERAEELAEQKFIASLPENKELIYFDNKNIVYSLNSYDEVQGVAAVSASFEGKITLKEDSNIIEVDKILGLNKKQLDAYLKALPEVAGYDVKYYPTFIKRVPKLVDRIKIEIKK